MAIRAFVTGGTGFIGANLVRLLVQEGYKVRVLVRPSSCLDNLRGLDVEVVKGDLNNPDLWQQMLGCQVLFHVAARYSLWQVDREQLYRDNVLGTRQVLAAAKKANIERIVYTSSVAAIGVKVSGVKSSSLIGGIEGGKVSGVKSSSLIGGIEGGKVSGVNSSTLIGGIEGGVDETHQSPLDQLIGHYKKSKFLAEQEAMQAVDSGQDVVVVNPSSPIGPLDIKPTPTGDIILRFLRRKMPFYLDTGLNFIDVRDVAWGHILALEKGKKGDRYILGNQNLTLKQLLDQLAEITNLSAPKSSIPAWLPLSIAWIDEQILAPLGKQPSVPLDGVRMAHQRMYYDASKAVRELGLPQSPINTALKDAVDWFVVQGYVN